MRYINLRFTLLYFTLLIIDPHFTAYSPPTVWVYLA